MKEDKPRALEKRRKRTSMQGDNILGEEKKAKVVLLRGLAGIEVWLMSRHRTCRRAWQQKGGADQDQDEWRTACGMWENRERTEDRDG